MVQCKRSYLNIFNLSLVLPCIFKVTMVFFTDILEEFYILAVIIDPLPNVFVKLTTYILKLIIKIHGTDRMRMFQNCRFYRA